MGDKEEEALFSFANTEKEKSKLSKMLTPDDFKDSKIDKCNGDPLHWLAEIMSVVLERRKLKEEDVEWEVSIPKRKRSKRQRPVCCPFAPPVLVKKEKESEGPDPKRKRRRPVGPFPPPDVAKDLRRHIVEKKLKLKEEEEGEWEGLKPKLKKSTKPRPICPIPPPDLPENFRRHIYETMGGSGLILVIQKAMFFSDINPSASRFSMPFSQVSTHDFLNETEAAALDDKENDQDPMKVSLLDPLMMETTLTFNKWVMNNTSLYVMTKAWNSVVKNNGFKQHDIVQLWSFRVNSRLCFALVKL